MEFNIEEFDKLSDLKTKNEILYYGLIKDISKHHPDTQLLPNQLISLVKKNCSPFLIFL